MKENFYIQKELKTKPIINMLFYSTLVQILELQIMKEVYEEKYTCENRKDALYNKYRKKMKTALSKMKNKNNVHTLSETILHSNGGLFIEKINHKFCKRKIVGYKEKVSKTQFRWLGKSGFLDTYNKMKNKEY
jgi:Flp pilus assembly CpaF family ATPase